jgi:hypothetical protein
MLTNNNTTIMPNTSLTNTHTPPAWSLFSWPAVFCQANLRGQPRFVHVGTRIVRGGDDNCPLSGQTLWAQPLVDGHAGLAWDWVELTHGVVAMANPMGVVTNLRLVSHQGEVLTAHQAAVHISRLVHQIPWQDEVWRVLHAA